MHQGRKRATNMGCTRQRGVVVVVTALMLASFAGAQQSNSAVDNTAVLRHMQELEQEVQELRSEVAALKSADKFPSTSTAVTTVQNSLVSSTSGPDRKSTRLNSSH